jgi:ferredoxin
MIEQAVGDVVCSVLQFCERQTPAAFNVVDRQSRRKIYGVSQQPLAKQAFAGCPLEPDVI